MELMMMHIVRRRAFTAALLLCALLPLRAHALTPEEVAQNNYFALGSPDAEILIVEFIDYQCPYCAIYLEETLPQIMEKYIATGEVRYVVKNFPIASNLFSFKAAEAALCAGDQNFFWQYRKELLSNKDQLDADKLQELSEGIGMDGEEFRKCLSSGKFSEAVTSSIEFGADNGVTAAPSFLIVSRSSEWTSSQLIVGAQPYSVFADFVSSAHSN